MVRYVNVTTLWHVGDDPGIALWQRVIASSLAFSGIRLRNFAAREG